MEPKVYRSNYEYKCQKCPYPIKPQTGYYIKKIKAKDGTLIPWRYHVDCPKENHGISE